MLSVGTQPVPDAILYWFTKQPHADSALPFPITCHLEEGEVEKQELQEEDGGREPVVVKLAENGSSGVH